MPAVPTTSVQLVKDAEKDFRFYGKKADNSEKPWKSFSFTTSGTVLNGNPLATITQNASEPTKFRVKNLTNQAGNKCYINFNGINGNDLPFTFSQEIQLMPADSDPITSGAVDITDVV